MNNEVKIFLDKVFKLRKEGCNYNSFGYQKEYQKMENCDYGYIPFLTGLGIQEIDNIIPDTNPNNRCGKVRESTKYIVIHDTASGAPSADAAAHQRWLMSMADDPNSTYAVSWHFTVDDHTIIKHLPVDEIAYHAGDGTRVKLDYLDTKIPHNGDTVKITINDEGYFEINGLNTNILSPRTDEDKVVKSEQLPSLGVNWIVGENGNYFISNTYWNAGYQVLANRGGNLNSVGIETCVNFGNDYIKTMRITAYLVANLLDHYDLDESAVKQHNSFSGKDCPMTIRHANKWDEFIELVKLNLEYLQKFKDLDLKFISLDEDYLDHSGKIKCSCNCDGLKYKVVVDKDEYYYEVKMGSK